MVNARARQVSGWTYDTSSSSGMSVGVVAAEDGKIILFAPGGAPRFAFDYTAVGAGASYGFKLPGLGKLQLGGGISANFALQANHSGGTVYILDTFKGKELTPRDIAGFCLLVELGVGTGIAGMTLAGMICNLSPQDLRQGLLEEFIIDTSVQPLIANELNKAGITDKLGIQNATAVITMYGFNQGLQLFAGGTAYLGYLSIGGPPDEDPMVLFDAQSPENDGVKIIRKSRDHGWVVLNGDVLFKFGHYTLTFKAQTTLARVATFLRSQGGITRIMVNGHTDSIGPAGFNMTLSRFRAKTVAEWLSRNMAPTTMQIDWQGFGESDPVASNTTRSGADNPLGRRRNRRVEVHYYQK
jgi:outer membrane protein OmpA-like peptidoglycan-associated protein